MLSLTRVILQLFKDVYCYLGVICMYCTCMYVCMYVMYVHMYMYILRKVYVESYTCNFSFVATHVLSICSQKGVAGVVVGKLASATATLEEIEEYRSSLHKSSIEYVRPNTCPRNT